VFHGRLGSPKPHLYKYVTQVTCVVIMCSPVQSVAYTLCIGVTLPPTRTERFSCRPCCRL